MRVRDRRTAVCALVLSLGVGCASSPPPGPQAAPTTGSGAPSPRGSVFAAEHPQAPGSAFAPRADKKARVAVGKPIPGQYIVTLNQGEDPRSVAAIAHVDPMYVYENALLGFAAHLNAGQLNALRHNKAVEAIEQDQVMTTGDFVTQTIGSTGQPWGIDRIDQRLNLSRTYSYWSSGTFGGGYGVRAYIIDSGIATADSDFGGRASIAYDAFGGDGQDCNGHGTHVAGIVGGATYGVAKRVKLRGVRVFSCNGQGSVATIMAGVNWVRANAIKPAVANMSIGCINALPCASMAENTAVTNLVNSGVFVAVAAGNFTVDACTSSPASATGTVTVAASDWLDGKASYSNYGSCVDIYAPGDKVLSDWISGGTNVDSGTSMASPHVAGVAAILKSDYGDQPSSTITSWILNAATTNAIKGNVAGTPNRLLYMGGW